MTPSHHFPSRFQAKILTNSQKSLRERPKPPSKKQKNVKLSENRCFVQNGFVNSRPHMAALADPQSGTYSYIDPLSFIVSSKTGLSRQKYSLLPKGFNNNPSFSRKNFSILEPFYIYFWKNM